MGRKLALDRRGSMPRSGIFLAALLVVAVAVLFFLRRNPPPVDYTLGGKLFTAAPEEIDELLLTRGGAQYRINRSESGQWTLSGAVSDFLDQTAVSNLLDNLTQATGGRLLPGSQLEDRRYEFNGPGAVRLTLFSSGGVTEKLAIGTNNPVTGSYYGSGAGRQACFPVSVGLREILSSVPANLQLKTLLPGVDRQDVAEIEIWRGDQLDLLQRWHQRWWLRMPAAGEASLGTWYRDYSAHYKDRVTQREDTRWLLADDRSIRLLIHQSTQIIVKEILLPSDAARLIGDLVGDHPWRRVVLKGEAINPDPAEGSADQLEIGFVQPLDESKVPALRRGSVVITEPEAIEIVSEPLSELLNSQAIDLVISLADSLVLEREGKLLLRAHRDKTPARPDERRKVRPVDFWLTDYPAEGTIPSLDDRARHGRGQNLLANLERTPMLRVLPPVEDPAVLEDRERLRLTLWFAEGSTAPGVGAGQVVLEIGYIDKDMLPTATGTLATSEDGLAPVGLWRPATGQLLQIPGYSITTARAWVQ